MYAIAIGLSLATSQTPSGGGVPGFTYLRPDGSSYILRPDGSYFIRP